MVVVAGAGVSAGACSGAGAGAGAGANGIQSATVSDERGNRLGSLVISYAPIYSNHDFSELAQFGHENLVHGIF